MKIAINQPYFLPYLGYFQLIAAADLFVAYENVAYTRKSWISRNRLQGKAREPYYISLPTVKVMSGTLIKDVWLHESAPQKMSKLLRRIRYDYAKSAFFEEVFGEIEQMLAAAPFTTINAFNNHCLKWICELLDIKTRLSFVHNELLGFENELNSGKGIETFCVKSQRVFGLMTHFSANHYLNLSGGVNLYGRDEFKEKGLSLNFLKIPTIDYPQFEKEFTPHLSILDVLLHCGVKQTRSLVYDNAFQEEQDVNAAILSNSLMGAQ